MTVSSAIATQTFTCDGFTTVFTCPFRVLDASELVGYLITIATNESALLINGTDFAVTGVGAANATATTTLAYSSAYRVNFRRRTQRLQSTDYRDNDPFPAESHENALDRLTHIAQEGDANVARALLVPEPENGVTLPAASVRADRLLGFDSGGGVVAVAPVSGSAAALATNLASSSSAFSGAGQVGYSDSLAYAAGTLGAAIRAMGRTLQGADPTGATDSTTALRALFDACIPAGVEAIIPAGSYLVSNAISNLAQIAAGALNIRCIGDVTITVSAGATAFTTLLSCYTTAINSSTIKGGRLTLNLNNRCANGIIVRHAGGNGGAVDWGPVTVLSARENATTTNENQGLLVYGRYESVQIDQPKIDGVTRVTAGGACKGISINDVAGEVRVVAPFVARVLTGGGAADADGVSVFGYQLNGVYGRRAGRVVIDGGTYIDCQGRSIKLQISEALIDRPTIYRKDVVTIAGTDIDAQVGGSILIRSPVFDYRRAAGVSPLDAAFYPVSLQQQCTDSPNDMQVIDSLLRTEVVMTRFCNLTIGATSLNGRAAVEGLRVQELGALATSAFTRAVLEFDAGAVAASAGTTHISVRGTRANLSGVPVLGHVGFGASVAAKLAIDVVGNENTGAVAANTRVIGAVSGGAITALSRFMIRDNAGVSDLLPLTAFDYALLPVGCRFHYSAVTASPTNGPALGGAGIACVEVLGQISEAAGARSIRVVKDNANAINTVYQTQTGTWGVIK